MWYLKEAAKKAAQAYNYSKSFVVSEDKTSEVTKLLDGLVKFQGEILPTSKMDQLVKLSYDYESFEEISNQMFERLKIFKYSLEGIKKAHNLLVIVSYLIKHGASGFIDEFRNSMLIFQNYQKLHKQKLFDQDSKKQMDMQSDIDTIKGKARHIEVLLTDKTKLLKQKQLAMLVKQKLKLYQQSKGSNLKQKPSQQKSQITKKSSSQSKDSNKDQQKKQQGRLNYLNDLMQKYLWTYVDKVDDTVSGYSQKVLGKLDKFIDKVIDGDVKPQAFQFEDENQIGQAQLADDNQINSYDKLQQIKNDIDKLEIKNEDLLQFDTPAQKQETKQQQSKEQQKKSEIMTIDLLG